MQTVRTIILPVLLLVLMIAGGYFVYQKGYLDKYIGRERQDTSQADFERESGIDLEGWVYFSMTAKDAPAAGVRTYIYDFTSAQALIYPNLNSLNGEDASLNIFHTMSTDATWVTFVGIPASRINAGLPMQEVMQVYRAPISAGDVVDIARFEEALAGAVQVSNRPGRKEIPQVNNRGGVIYALEADINNALSIQQPDSYHIYYVSADGEERFLMQGTHPRWVNDTTFVFLKNGGVFSYDITNNRTYRILPSEAFVGGVGANAGLAVSDDASMIAVSDPNGGTLSVYTIADWSNPIPSFLNSAAVNGFWPVFSPDGMTLAIQAVDVANIETDPNPRLQLYRVDKGTPNPTGRADMMMTPVSFRVPLDGFIQEQMFITDWAF